MLSLIEHNEWYLFIGNKEVAAVSYTKFLGTMIYLNFTRGNHIDHIKKKVVKGL